jgi:hypothetical protein
VTVVLAATLSLALSAPAPDEAELVNRALYNQAIEHLQRGDFQVAAALFAELHGRTGDPWALYNEAQAWRMGGDCKAAIRLYERFIETPAVDSRDRFQAEKNVERCKRELAEASKADAAEPNAGANASEAESVGRTEPTAVSSKSGANDADDPSRDDPLPPSETALGAPSESERTTARLDRQADRLGTRTHAKFVLSDPVGWVLAGTGSVALVSGIPLHVLGDRAANAQPMDLSQTELEYVEDIRRSRRQRAAGTSLMVIGSALVAAAVVRFVVVAVRNSPRRRSARTPRARGITFRAGSLAAPFEP